LDVGLALPAVPISLVGALAVAGLGGATGHYWWLFPVSIVVGAVLNAAVFGTLVQSRRTSRPRT
jgi:glycerol uptake facilitator-like aquaporin